MCEVFTAYDDSMHGTGRNTKRRALCQAAIDIGCL